MKAFVHAFLLLSLCLSQLSLTTQDKVTLRGKVTDRQGMPLSPVTIAVYGTTSGTYTDESGFYTLTVASGKQTLLLSFLGYETLQTTLEL